MTIKKATILFPLDLYRRLATLARDWHISLSELVTDACRAQYSDERRTAVAELARMALPVGSVEQMKRESGPVVKQVP